MGFFSADDSTMGKASAQLNKANANADVFGSRGGSAWDTLFPTLLQDATNPQGLSPQQKATMNTASSQSLGGSVAGATGQGALMAARTKNPGSATAALDASSKHAGETASHNALGVEEFSTNLAHQKQQNALRELGSLYGTNTGALSSMLDAANQALGIFNDAEKRSGSVLGDISQLANVGASIAGDVTGVAGMMPKGKGAAPDFSGFSYEGP
jgi:hypothetical protein